MAKKCIWVLPYDVPKDELLGQPNKYIVLDYQLIFLKCQLKFSINRNLGHRFTVVGHIIDPPRCPCLDSVSRLLYMGKEPCRSNLVYRL